MRISFWGNRGWRKELGTNPEGYIFVILIYPAIIIRIGALGCCQVLGLSVALGALWVVLFPRYLQDVSPLDVVAKSIFLLIVGVGIICSDWAGAMIHSIRLKVAGENEATAITAWIWVIGGLVAVSGLLGLLMCKRLSLAIRSCPNIVMRLCATFILFAATLLIVRATVVGRELLRIGIGTRGS